MPATVATLVVKPLPIVKEAVSSVWLLLKYTVLLSSINLPVKTEFLISAEISIWLSDLSLSETVKLLNLVA